MNPICKICNTEIDKNNYLKNTNVCKRCYNKIRRKNNNNTLIQNQPPKVDKISNNNVNNTSVLSYENHANVVIGPKNVGKTYYMLKMLEKV